MKPIPPQFIIDLIDWYCDPVLAEGIIGDLHEKFDKNRPLKGVMLSRMIFCFQAIGFFRWSFRNRNKSIMPMRSIWINYFKTARRAVLQHKLFFSINLIGLIFAIISALFAFVYVQDDLSYDDIHADVDQIHRLYKRHINVNEGVDHLTAETSGMMGPTLQREYPEVLESVRICPWWDEVLMFYENENHATNGWYFVDSNFLKVFDFNLIEGDAQQALIQPRSVIITESLAQRIYGDQEYMGQTFKGFGDLDYIVTGIMQDLPRQSTLQFEVLASWSTTVPGQGPLSFTWMNNWLAQGVFTFLKLEPNADPLALIQKMPDMMERHFPERADQYFLQLQPFKEVHLHSDNIRNQRGMDLSSMRFIILLWTSALLLVLIALVNHINISLSRSMESRLEVGVRKVLGSTRFQLLGRFIVETFFSTFFASLVAVISLAILIPLINQITGKALPVEVLYQPSTIGFLSLICLIFSLLLGFYPALVMSRPQVTGILKNIEISGSNTGLIRKTLLGFQYAIATILIIGTVAVIKQLDFLKSKPLGFDKENVMVVNLENEMGAKAEVFETELRSHPNIVSVSTGRSALGAGSFSTTLYPEGGTEDFTTRIFIVDPEFFETYGITTNEGRTFLKSSNADSSNIIVNQSLIDYLQWDEPLGKRLKSQVGETGFPIVGVVEDFHYNSLASGIIEPMVIFLDGAAPDRNASIKIGQGDLNETIAFVEKTWNDLADQTPFEFYFVDSWFDGLYQNESQLAKVSTIYSVVSLILCALGLYGMTALLLGQRKKEIGIRKVLGANTNSIIRLMALQFIPIILIGLVIAAPISYRILDNWLSNFAYKITLNLESFIIASVLILIISSFIIGLLSRAAANLNPSITLKFT